MTWWMWVVVMWVGAIVLMFMAFYIMSWWHRRSIDREWKKYDRTL